MPRPHPTPSSSKRPPSPAPRTRQQALWCPCGSSQIAARGLCSRCYARRAADRRSFAGLRERVLRRDGYACQCCRVAAQSGARRAVVVHHRRPGISRERLLITLCPGCHARVHHLLIVRRPLPLLLRELWREQHAGGSEQLALDFTPAPVQRLLA